MKIEYIERKTSQKCTEKVFGQKALLLLYGNGLFQRLFSQMFLPLIVRFPFLSKIYGLYQKLPSSKKRIAPFIEKYDIDASEFVEQNFDSFNDFFIRKLKAEKRPIAQDPTILTTPADGRYLVYPSFKEFLVKGKTFSLAEFLQNRSLANRYKEGSIAIARLCPSDYHRFHFPCDCIPSKPELINGFLYSVNPIALAKRLSILSENKRVITELATKNFGTILYVEIGATAVGSIQQTFEPDQAVKKGDEKGYFEFGGSCIVLLFEKNQILFDQDLIENTKQNLETRTNFGTSLGKSF